MNSVVLIAHNAFYNTYWTRQQCSSPQHMRSPPHTLAEFSQNILRKDLIFAHQRRPLHILHLFHKVRISYFHVSYTSPPENPVLTTLRTPWRIMTWSSPFKKSGTRSHLPLSHNIFLRRDVMLCWGITILHEYEAS